MKKYVYSVGEVAKILRAAPKTVSNWIDTGRLLGHRINTHRRVSEENLIAFMKANNFPLPTDFIYSEMGLKSSVPEDSYVFFKDGTHWCCVRPDFINLQESPAGFGLTFKEAFDDFTEIEKHERSNLQSSSETNDVNRSSDGTGQSGEAIEETSRSSEDGSGSTP